MALIRAFVGLLITVAVAGFAAMNLQAVQVFYSPVHDPVEVPLYLVALGLMAFGFLVGGFYVWLNGAAGRKTSRQQRKTIKSLEKELKGSHGVVVDSVASPPSEFFPALPKSKKSAIN